MRSVPRWLWTILALALLWSWSLYLAGWWLCPKKQRYFWVTFSVSDYNPHLRWARQAWEGKGRFVNLYTTEPHPALTFNLHDWLLGRFCRWTGMPLHFGSRLSHTVAVIVFVFAAWWLAKPFLTEPQQLTYLVMLCFLGGFPWLAMPEANTFIALATMPWFVWGKALAALMMGSLVRTLEGDWRWAIVGGIAGVVLGNVHPYALAPIGYGMLLWFGSMIWLRRTQQAARWTPCTGVVSAIVILPAIVSAAWQAWAILSDPIYRAEFQFPLETPPLWTFVINYGVIGVLSGLALPFTWRQARDENDGRWWLLATWLLGAFLAVHLTPTSQPRKLIEGGYLPMCVCAAWAWHEFVLPRSHAFRLHPLTALLAIGSLAPLTFWRDNVQVFRQDEHLSLHHQEIPCYLHESHIQLARWLERHAEPGDAILCAYQLGNYLPVLTGRRVFVGHWAGTLQVNPKLQVARQIWQGQMSAKEAQKLFRRHRLRYATATVYERHEANGRLRLDRYGEIVYRVGNDAVYQLRW